jgi:prevent-host-death family protein
MRVQCKWARRKGNVISIGLSTNRRGPDGYIRGKYSAVEVDAIGAYCEELHSCFLIPIEVVAGQWAVQLRLAPARNGQRAALHLADEYRLGAVAQLEERRRGTAEATGSSPVSSTPNPAALTELSFPVRDGFADLKQTVGMDEFYAKLAQYVRRAETGEEVLVTRWGKPVARLGPVIT